MRTFSYLASNAWNKLTTHADGMKWKHFPRYWHFVMGNSPVTGGFPSQMAVGRSFGVFSVSDQTVKQTIETLVIWDAIALIMTSL